MQTIKLFGIANCHKTQFYKQRLMDDNIPFDFYDIEENPMHKELLSFYYSKGQTHFPTLVIGDKILRNPTDKAIQKQILSASIDQLDEGYSEVIYQGSTYTVTKENFNDGKSIKVFAQSLSSNDFISFNMYHTKAGTLLKPCEMPEKKVIHFLKQFQNINGRTLSRKQV